METILTAELIKIIFFLAAIAVSYNAYRLVKCLIEHARNISSQPSMLYVVSYSDKKTNETLGVCTWFYDIDDDKKTRILLHSMDLTRQDIAVFRSKNDARRAIRKNHVIHAMWLKKKEPTNNWGEYNYNVVPLEF
jgi:hypothetical protein